MDTSFLNSLSDILRNIAFALLYFVIGSGPGFAVGVLLANKFTGKNNPIRMDKHTENIQKARQHNSQWNPNNPKWK